MTAARKGPGRPARISRTDVEQAVLTIGFRNASTTAVARHLGVEQSSLYRHIGSRRELLRGAVDRAVANHPRRFPHSTWREYLTGVSAHMWDLLMEHPGMAETLHTLEEHPPRSLLTLMERSVRVLNGTYRWERSDALLVLDSLTDMTSDTVNRTERLLAAHPDSDADPDRAARDLFQRSELSPDLTDALAEILDGGLEQWWWRKVNLLLDGAEHLAP
ncbi:TetR/AcrR family transcriptional regulator [Corynebacterium sp. P7202]|uniref:Helix-turn-helix domain containing protein n=1 Tax=Corynebacterium pygosceleis TaxID=2800406 RepID=A0A9Q4CAA7_9CORY|nr:TetR/AcrR family transcriptional regulator [Corynebacterium pygosceleis]MCK7638558.1 TetR/AcrR family transcriptional regulator [Corynebacterium pygosceleis]MCX7469299.1 helix-turn-helix domain containing protein [Corynebacterium pygosceleis]